MLRPAVGHTVPRGLTPLSLRRLTSHRPLSHRSGGATLLIAFLYLLGLWSEAVDALLFRAPYISSCTSSGSSRGASMLYCCVFDGPSAATTLALNRRRRGAWRGQRAWSLGGVCFLAGAARTGLLLVSVRWFVRVANMPFTPGLCQDLQLQSLHCNNPITRTPRARIL